MEKKVFFRGWLLPILLISPQLIISIIFFFYPAGQAISNSLYLPDPFGLSSEFVGLENFLFLFGDSYYLSSFLTTIFFSTSVSVLSMGLGLYFALLADRIFKGAGVYKTLLIWPYAVAPAVAGVLWMFLFSSRVGVVSWYLGLLGYDWNHGSNRNLINLNTKRQHQLYLKTKTSTTHLQQQELLRMAKLKVFYKPQHL